MTILSTNENRALRCLDMFFYIDTNRINAKKGELNMNQLEKWRDNGLIYLLMPEAAYQEIMNEKSNSKGTKMRKRKAYNIVILKNLLQQMKRKNCITEYKIYYFRMKRLPKIKKLIFETSLLQQSILFH